MRHGGEREEVVLAGEGDRGCDSRWAKGNGLWEQRATPMPHVVDSRALERI